MRITSSGNVGIGTTSPLYKLQVAASGDSSIVLANETTNTDGQKRSLITKKSDNNLEIRATDSAFTAETIFSRAINNESARIDSNGRLLVGTSNTTTTGTLFLQGISGNPSSGAYIHLQRGNVPSGSGSPIGSIFFADNGSNLGASIASASEGAWTSGSSHPGRLVFSTTADGASSPTERMRINSGGRLLVGTSSGLTTCFGSPVERLAIAGGAGPQVIGCYSNDQFAARLDLIKSRSASVNGQTIVQANDSLGEFYFGGSDGTGVIPAARIVAQVDGTPGTNDMPGRLVFAVTADGASTPTERMRIDRLGRIFAFSTNFNFPIRNTNAAGTSIAFLAGYHSATDVTTGGTNSFNVFTNGNVTNTNNSYGAISDVKLKENIVDANSQWDDLKALQVRNYNFKEGQTHTQIGVVAQEVELISPGLVTESPDRDDEGNDLGTVTKSVNYSVLYMKAVKALQEAMERIEALEQRLADAGL